MEKDIQSGQRTNNLHQSGYRLLQHAAHACHGPALHHLALLHNQRNDLEVFHQLLNKDMDNPESLFLLSHCRYFGSDGYSQNLSVALDYFLAAADHKHKDAMVSAGAMVHQVFLVMMGKQSSRRPVTKNGTRRCIGMFHHLCLFLLLRPWV